MAEPALRHRPRQLRGRTSYHAGQAAEDSVARDYSRRGYASVARRHRGPGGEIDLIMRAPDGLVFIEVKASATHAQAAERITPRQAARIQASAQAFVAREPLGQLTPMRFDVALVDAAGRIEVLENAFM